MGSTKTKVIQAFIGSIVVAVALGLSGCSDQTESEDESSQAAQMNQEAEDCLNLWLNTQAPQWVIDDGMEPTHDRAGGSAPSPVFQDNNGVYHINRSSPGFKTWSEHGVPWGDIKGAILDGQGCPFSAG